eukprot:g7590.t1
MASLPAHFVTHVKPADGGVDPPPPPYPGPGVNLSDPPPPAYPGPRVILSNPPMSQPAAPAVNVGYPPPAVHLGCCARNAVKLWNSCVLWLSDRRRRREEERPTVLASETRVWKWALFVVGNIVTVAGVVFEISELDVCFDETVVLGDDDDDVGTPQENAETTYQWTMAMFVVGLWVDLFSAVSLSAIYRYPLDIKSAHLIPPEDTRNKRMKSIINFLAPFSWGVVYMLGGLVSMNHGENFSCGGGVDSSGFSQYLYTSGAFMTVFGVFLLGLSVFMTKAACCPSTTPLGAGPTGDNCCAKCVRKLVLTKSWALDFGWQVHGTILSYRIGAIGLTAAILVGLFGGLGEVLAALGSMVSNEVREIVGPVAL